MRTTVDIPDPVYRALKSEAALEGRSIKELIVRRVTKAENGSSVRPKFKFPAIKAKKPGSLKLGSEGVYEYIPFP